MFTTRSATKRTRETSVPAVSSRKARKTQEVSLAVGGGSHSPPKSSTKWASEEPFVPEVIILPRLRRSQKYGDSWIEFVPEANTHSPEFAKRCLEDVKDIKLFFNEDGFDENRDGAIKRLTPLKDSGLKSKKLGKKYDPAVFQAIDFGEPEVQGHLTQNEKIDALNAFDDGILFTIRDRKRQAAELARTPDWPFCDQQWKLWHEDSEAQIFKEAFEIVSTERRIALGGHALGRDLMQQLPRGTESELKKPALYVTYTERPGQTGGYVGSAASKMFGSWPRLAQGYETDKRYAKLGVVKANRKGRHLEFALHSDAEMHLRIFASFDWTSTSADRIVRMEDLFTIFLRTLGSGKVKYFDAIRMNSMPMYEASLTACVPERRPRAYIGLNTSLPSRQGSGQMPGSIWSKDVWNDQDIEPMGPTMHERLVEEGCCICGSHERPGALSCALKSPEYEGKVWCINCYTDAQRHRAEYDDDHSWVEARLEIVAKRPEGKTYLQRLRESGCCICRRKEGLGESCTLTSYQGQVWCGSCRRSHDQTHEKDDASWVLARRAVLAPGTRTYIDRLREDGCCICHVTEMKGKPSGCKLQSYKDQVWCSSCRSHASNHVGDYIDEAAWVLARQAMLAHRSCTQRIHEDGCCICYATSGKGLNCTLQAYKGQVWCEPCSSKAKSNLGKYNDETAWVRARREQEGVSLED